MDNGKITICELKKTSPNGKMPTMNLIPVKTHYYGERTVGYNRQYAAMGVNEYIDMLVRIWQDRSIKAGMYAVIENGGQYRIDNVQQLFDENGLRVTDLTLGRLDKLYDVAGEVTTN